MPAVKRHHLLLLEAIPGTCLAQEVFRGWRRIIIRVEKRLAPQSIFFLLTLGLRLLQCGGVFTGADIWRSDRRKVIELKGEGSVGHPGVPDRAGPSGTPRGEGKGPGPDHAV